MIAIIISSSDPAGTTIRQQLLKNYGFEAVKDESFEGFPVFRLQFEDKEARLFTTAREAVHCEGFDKRIPADLFVFATKHFSKAGVPALTTHSVGNWGRAQLGGRDSTLCPSPAVLLKFFLQNLAAVARSEGYDGEVVQEATHHGPFIEKPAAFIEVGSSKQEWKDERLASMVADSLIGGLGDYIALSETHEPVVALGGLHYAESFKKLMLESNYAVGHICPKHSLGSLTAELLMQAMSSCWPETAKAVALDWKGLGSEKQRAMELLESSGIKHFRA
ncbi:hypothetical protein HYU17_05000 [Candidatus Woesearchaeota archaeon]|nr:hypothetical protein [Candidatus Woesearchaeota archaeon]